jgi:hypothetical protein
MGIPDEIEGVIPAHTHTHTHTHTHPHTHTHTHAHTHKKPFKMLIVAGHAVVNIKDKNSKNIY